MQRLHGAADGFVREHRITFHVELADLDFGPFLHVEDHLDRGRRDLRDLRLDLGVLAPTLPEQFAQYHDCPLDAGGIVAGLDAQTDPALLEALENIRDSGGLKAFVLDASHDATLGGDKAYDPAGVALFQLKPKVVEVAGVPQHHEIAPQDLFVDCVARFREDSRQQAGARNAARAAELDVLDEIVPPPAGSGLAGFVGDVLKRRGRLLLLFGGVGHFLEGRRGLLRLLLLVGSSFKRRRRLAALLRQDNHAGMLSNRLWEVQIVAIRLQVRGRAPLGRYVG